MMGMVLLFAMLETTAKFLSQTYPVPLIVWFRYVTHFFLMLLLLGPRYGSRLIKTDNPKAQIIRALLLMGSTLLYFTALSGLPLATAKSISFVSPLLVTIFALWFLKEHVSLGRWIAVVVGLLGVLLVISPSGKFDWYFGLPLMAAVCYSLYQIMTRRFSATEHPVTTLFYTGFVGSIVISLVVPIFWVAPQIRDLPAFLFLGFAGAFGHFMLIKAMELEDASFLSPLTYVQLIWVTLLGYFAFDHLPTNVGFVGMAIIVGAGLYVALGARESSTRHRSP
ncbi:MAG TPA: EamA/RhaT family transporter [Betaproteobacteria bacterium]|jgi:drug/metabolite transporter (DMT)-like permease|nr:DMT family transporter [Betaproteobacteria bacterium]HAT51934.1 EamA/RhaT family transporter [Betaproteobacteria bacterium]HAU83638.1 EamA/RhaT family transporter [Betaproteobacteria bacterium]